MPALIRFVLLCLPWALPAWAQESAVRPERFSTRDGLVHNRVNALYHQPDGYLWIGTQGGLCRFDGRNFDDLERFPNLPKGTILQLDGDDRGQLLVLTEQVLCRFDGESFQTLYTEEKHDLETFFLDSRGRIWIGSRLRLILLDGPVVRDLGSETNLPATRIKFVFEDSNNRIWVGLRPGGLARFEEGEGKFSVFSTSDGLPHDTVNAVFESRSGLLWVATHGGLAYFEEPDFQPASFNDALQSPIIFNIVEDAQGGLWFNAPTGGVSHWDGLKLTIKTAEDGLAGNNITDMHCDRRGRLWFIANRSIVVSEGDSFHQVDIGEKLSSSLVTCFHEGGDGLMWVGTSSGFFRFEDECLVTYLRDPTDQRLPTGSRARAIITDSRGHLWFPSLAGLGFYNHKTFRLFTELTGLPDNQVHVFCEDVYGHIWVGTEQGVAMGDGFGFKPLVQPELKGRPAVAIAADTRGRVWILDRDWHLWRNDNPRQSPNFRAAGTFEGAVDLKTAKGVLWVESRDTLYRLDSELQTIDLKRLLPQGETARLFHEGEWWFGTGDDLCRYDGSTAQTLVVPGPEQVGRIFITPSGACWLVMVTAASGLFPRSLPAALMWYNGNSFSRFDKDNGLLSADVSALFPDAAGGFWLASDKGLSRYREGVMRHLLVRDGLSGNQPADVLRDGQGNLWIATNGGLNKFREHLRAGAGEGDRAATVPLSPDSGLLTSLSQQDGLLDPVVHAIAADANDRLWIRTRSGVQQYRESAMRPKIGMTVFINGQAVAPGEDHLELAHDHNNILFRLSSIYLRRGNEQTHFAYNLRLGTYQKPLPVLTRESEIRFANLKPGDYTFEVVAYDRDLYSSDPVSFHFHILAPFWFRPWFLVVGILSGLLVSYIFYRRRLRDKLEKARVLNELQAAHRMQIGLMPTRAPDIEGFEIFGICEPAREVGGDFFDYFWLDDEERQLGITVMDVSGKSMEAAIISVMASGLVYSEVGSAHTPAAIFTKINYAMFKKTGKKVFTSGLLLALDVARRTVVWANAGHMDPILIRSGKYQKFPHPGQRDLPLGAREHTSYGQRELALQAGDLLLLYTDGLSEAVDMKNLLFSEQRIVDYLERHAGAPAEMLVRGLLEQARTFAGGVSQHDDITILAIRFAG